MVKFYSQEFCDQVCEAMNKDEYYLGKTKDYLTFKWANILTDCPGGVDKLVRVELREGRCLGYSVQEKLAPSEWRQGRPAIPDGDQHFAVVMGTYESWVMLNRKKITALQAVTRKIYHIDAPMGKFMAMFARLVMWNDIIQSIPCTYE